MEEHRVKTTGSTGSTGNTGNTGTPPAELKTQSPVSISGPAHTSGRAGTAPSSAAASRIFASAASSEEPFAPPPKQENSISDEPGASCRLGTAQGAPNAQYVQPDTIPAKQPDTGRMSLPLGIFRDDVQTGVVMLLMHMHAYTAVSARSFDPWLRRAGRVGLVRGLGHPRPLSPAGTDLKSADRL
ncbi:hypothetical protein E4U41_003069 [Claviceps citrina]|nr:hypothetical protein E4U41_003069 [Claviceps citrina]